MTNKAFKTGLIVAVFFAAWHTCWALLVAMGWAQAVVDFVFWMHFIKPPYTVGPFNIWTSVILVGATAAIGFVIGYLFVLIWSAFQRHAA